MWSPRAQCDRGKFIWEWRRRLDETPNLDVWQDQAEELLVEDPANDSQGTVKGVRTIWGVELRARAVVITAGTFLNGLMHIGRKMVAGGRIAEPAVQHLTESITRHGIRSARMKTGIGTYEDRYTRAYRQAVGTFRRPGDTRGRTRLPPVLIYGSPQSFAPTHLLDL